MKATASNFVKRLTILKWETTYKFRQAFGFEAMGTTQITEWNNRFKDLAAQQWRVKHTLVSPQHPEMKSSLTNEDPGDAGLFSDRDSAILHHQGPQLVNDDLISRC